MKKSRFGSRLLQRLVAVLVVAVAWPVAADVALPDLFSDHAVLLRSERVPVWGWAEPGEEVVVEIAGRQARAAAGSDGRWQVDLDLHDRPAGPHELKIAGKNRLVISDVLIGEVWLCSGQSNMAWPLARASSGAAEIARARDGRIREFKVAMTPSLESQRDVRGHWAVFDSVTGGEFSAVGYFFAKSLHEHLSLPVGLINATWGGTPLAAWMSTAAAAKKPAVAEEHRKLKADFRYLLARQNEYETAWMRWCQTYGREIIQDVSVPPPEDARWKDVTMPETFAAEGLPEAGVVWLKREVVLPSNCIQKPLTLNLGVPEGSEEVFWNGRKLSERVARAYSFQRMRRQYLIPAAEVRAEGNQLLVRLKTLTGRAGLGSSPEGFSAGPVDLSGSWKAAVGLVLPPLDDTASRALPTPPEVPALAKLSPSSLFQGMIAPLAPYAIRGILWYQGEADTCRPGYYREAFPLLIADWRKQWGREELPFYFCQLPRFSPLTDENGNPNWAEFRAAQDAALQMSHSGRAVLIDGGQANDIHPREKRPAGKRLARLALGQVYGCGGVWQGPEPQRIWREQATVKVTFASLDEGSKILQSEGPVAGFSLRDATRGWIEAKARWDGDTLVVSADGCSDPKGIRYAWSNSPMVSLFNRAGLPAAPFEKNHLAFPDLERQ